MGKSVGLEIHSRGVRAVEVAGRGKNVRVLRYVDKALLPRGGAPDPEELQDALNSIFKGAKFSKNSVVTSLPADETVVREIPVPFKADDQIRKVIKYEAEHHLHDCDADDVVVQYVRVGESAEGANLLVFSARKDDISRRIEYARGAGVEPLAMDLDALAFYNAVRASGALDESPDCVLLNIAHRSTEMVFVQEGAARALRSVRMGVDSIAQGLARDMDIDFLEADSKLSKLTGDGAGQDLFVPEGETDHKPETEKSHAELEHDIFEQKRDDFLARLRREYVRSSAAMRGGRAQKIIATGPGLRVPGLLALLGQRLGIAVEAFLPSQAFACKLNGAPPEEFDSGAAVALGLALKGIGSDATGIDFRQEELKVANKFELLKTTLAVTVTLAFLSLMGASFYFVYKRQTLLEDRYDELVLKAYQSFSQVAQKYNELGGHIVSDREKVDPGQVEMDGPRPEAIRRFVARLKRMRAKLTRKFGGDSERGGVTPITSALRMWNDIFGVFAKLHEEIRYVDFKRIDIKQDSVELELIVHDVAAIERLEEPLGSLDVMKGMEFNRSYTITPLLGTNRQQATLEWKRPQRGRRRR